MIFSIQRVMPFALAFCAFFSALAVRAIDADSLAARIAPYLDDQTILVAHVDLRRIDVDAAIEMLGAAIPIEGEIQGMIDTAAAAAKAWLAGFQKAGGRDVFAALSVADIGRHDGPDLPVFLVVPLTEGGNAAAIEGAIPTNKAKNYPFQVAVRIPAGGPLVVGSRVTIDRIQTRYVEHRAADKYLADAFAAADDSALQIVFTPTDDHRRVIREMLPRMPKPFDAIDGPALADGILWKRVGIDLPPDFQLRSVVGAKNPAAAERLAAGWTQLLAFAATDSQVRKHVPKIDRPIALLQPTVDGDRIVVTMSHDAVMPIVKHMLLPALKAAQANASHSTRINQFKQLALAMHNWADSHSKKIEGKRSVATFPPAAIRGQDGKPLLSWRVAVLPYLEQQSLYDQFHLDEPWDSEHNKGLLGKMPEIFKDPELASTLNLDRPPLGHTTYVVPIGAGLVFGRNEGTALKEITDGMSNTILLVEVVPELAVPWTKPANWEVEDVKSDPKTGKVAQGDPLRGVRRSDGRPFTAAFCDGSVHVIAGDVDPSTLWHLLTRAGGEVVGDY